MIRNIVLFVFLLFSVWTSGYSQNGPGIQMSFSGLIPTSDDDNINPSIGYSLQGGLTFVHRDLRIVSEIGPGLARGTIQQSTLDSSRSLLNFDQRCFFISNRNTVQFPLTVSKTFWAGFGFGFVWTFSRQNEGTLETRLMNDKGEDSYLYSTYEMWEEGISEFDVLLTASIVYDFFLARRNASLTIFYDYSDVITSSSPAAIGNTKFGLRVSLALTGQPTESND